MTVLSDAQPGEVYNIGGNNEIHNIDLVKMLLDHLGKPHSLITFVKDRPGHDRRYAIDASKLRRELGWIPKRDFPGGLKATVEWYLGNQRWLKGVVSGEYQQYYGAIYGNR